MNESVFQVKVPRLTPTSDKSFSGIQIRRQTTSGDIEQNTRREVVGKVGTREGSFQKPPILRICDHPPQHRQQVKDAELSFRHFCWDETECSLFMRRCIHSDTLEGKQQIQTYGTPISVEGIFQLCVDSFFSQFLDYKGAWENTPQIFIQFPVLQNLALIQNRLTPDQTGRRIRFTKVLSKPTWHDLNISKRKLHQRERTSSATLNEPPRPR